jgi:hypothetical protein
MDALEAWGDSKFDRGPKTIRAYFQTSGIYIFLISFACVYYVSNAPLLLDHYDLGWHLAELSPNLGDGLGQAAAV